MLLTSTPNKNTQEGELNVTASSSGATVINILPDSTNNGYSFYINGLLQNKSSYSVDPANNLLNLPSSLNIIQGDQLTFLYFTTI